jgi:hypothetical protein
LLPDASLTSFELLLPPKEQPPTNKTKPNTPSNENQ